MITKSEDAPEAIEIELIRIRIKQLLKERGLRYEDMARHLNVSEPTVKRMLNKGELTLQRVAELATILGTSLFDLVDEAKTVSRQYRYMSDGQEEFLMHHMDTGRFLVELLHGRTVQEIGAMFKLGPADIDYHVRHLERVGLVAVTTTGALRIAPEAMRGPRPGGSLDRILWQRFRETVPGEIAALMGTEAGAALRTSNHGFAEVVGYQLSDASMAVLRRRLHELHAEIASLERAEMTAKARHLTPYTIVNFVYPKSIYAAACGDIRPRPGLGRARPRGTDAECSIS